MTTRYYSSEDQHSPSSHSIIKYVTDEEQLYNVTELRLSQTGLRWYFRTARFFEPRTRPWHLPPLNKYRNLNRVDPERATNPDYNVQVTQKENS